ncbi:MAG TPA: PTS sugar transporter subunit IIA [bacterium]|nr:PTS sugar transporter subunit IIA [bacterium]
MHFSAILDEKVVILDLKAKTKEEAIKELIHQVEIAKDRVPSAHVLEDAVLERERNGSTAFGAGLCFPHARIDGLRDIVIAIGISKSGIAVDAPDRKKGSIFFLILAPATKNILMLQALAALAGFAKVAANRTALLEAKKPGDLVDAIVKSGVRMKKELVAGDLMNTNVVSVSPEMTMKEVVTLFFKKGIDSAPVLGPGDKLIGDLSGKELVSVGLPSHASLLGNIAYLADFEPFDEFFKKQNTIKVKNLCSISVVKVKPDMPLIEAAYRMVKEDARRVYVVDDSDKLQGVIYRKDIICRILYS